MIIVFVYRDGSLAIQAGKVCLCLDGQEDGNGHVH